MESRVRWLYSSVLRVMCPVAGATHSTVPEPCLRCHRLRPELPRVLEQAAGLQSSVTGQHPFRGLGLRWEGSPTPQGPRRVV